MQKPYTNFVSLHQVNMQNQKSLIFPFKMMLSKKFFLHHILSRSPN